MKTSTIVGIVAAVVVVAGGAWYWSTMHTATVADTQHVGGPSNAMGLNGSPNQGNLGQPDQGTPQHPGQVNPGDGTTPGVNLTLGITADAKLGSYLNAYNGMTLYTYTKDTAGVSNCSGTCAVNWPPYTVQSAADLHLPVNIKGKLGTTKRADGTLQVTFNGKPLYFWKNDTKPGDTTGQAVGGVWFVAKS